MASANAIDGLMRFRGGVEAETTGVDFTQHAETAYAEGVHGYQPSRRPATFGAPGASAPRSEKPQEGWISPG